MKELKTRLGCRFLRCLIDFVIWADNERAIDALREVFDDDFGRAYLDPEARSLYRSCPRYLQKTLTKVWTFLWVTDED